MTPDSHIPALTGSTSDQQASNVVLPRRRFLRTAAFAATALGATPSIQTGSAAAQSSPPMLSVAGYPYERVKALQQGDVSVDGWKLDFETDKIGDLNRHIFSGRGTRHVSEVGLIPYLLAFASGFRDYLLLPIFVLKVFRHKSIFVHADRGIRKPADLRGRRVATVGYSSSGLTWIRGILADEYGVTPADIRWVLTTEDSAAKQTGGASAWETRLPRDIQFERAPAGRSDSDLLLDGEVDAIFHPAEPSAYVERHPKVRRLFDDSRQVEQQYFTKTGIFPIMHAVAIRRELVEQHGELPAAVFQAYCDAKRHNFQEMRRIRWAYDSLPWYGQEFDETVRALGDNFYSYGLPKNRLAMQTVLRYLDEQGLTDQRLPLDELFAKGTHMLDDK